MVVPSDASDLCTSLTVTVRQSTLQGHAKDLKYQFSSGRLMACSIALVSMLWHYLQMSGSYSLHPEMPQ